MAEKITTGDILNIDGFDPMAIDVTYIKETMEEMPKDGLIDINNAERLATMFLRCADYCGDLLAKALRYLGHKETLKRAGKSSAVYRKIKEKVTPTVAKEAFADDDEYIRVANEATDAEALLKWIDEKYQDLIKAHIMCKSILSRHATVERANSWQGSESETDYEPTSLSASPSSAPSRKSNDLMKPGFIDL